MNKKVAYPIVGMAHITEDISDLIKYKLTGQEQIILNTSSQPNSSPHLGTITTLMTVFSMAEHFRHKLGIPVSVQFDELENSPGYTKEIKGMVYYKSLNHTYIDSDKDIATINMEKYKKILDDLSNLSGIPFNVRTYYEFQQNTHVRRAIIDIFNNQDFFESLFSPSKGQLHVRIICSKCQLGLKSLKTIDVESNANKLVFQSKCPYHGLHKVCVTPINSEFIDINTQFRDLTKGIQLLNDDIKNNTLSIMVDGNDWSGIWAQRIHTEGMVKLGYSDFIIRLFTPTLLDWSGGKLSKTLYLCNGEYNYLHNAFLNYDFFMKQFNYEGFIKLWEEVRTWVEHPPRFFRNYSVEYLSEVLKL